MSSSPADLDQLLASIREELTTVRRSAVELAGEYRRLPVEQLAVDTLGDPLTPSEALGDACDGLDGFAGALALADDAASIVRTYTTGLQR